MLWLKNDSLMVMDLGGFVLLSLICRWGWVCMPNSSSSLIVVTGILLVV